MKKSSNNVKILSTSFENKFMQLATREAKKAFRAMEVPVGCVIVSRVSGVVIAKARNQMQKRRNPNAHAEILAINKACTKLGSKNLSECDIYVTLEPCTMCSSAISNARFGRLYYGASDEKHGAVEHGVRFFTSGGCFHRPEIYPGINKDELGKLIQVFFSQIRKNQV